MRFEDMKNNIPETPDFIHEMIKNEVDRQLQETKIIAIPKKRKRWNKARVAAATIVCVLATTTAAYAGVKMYRMYVEKQGDYSVKTGITSENKLADLPAQIHSILFRYIISDIDCDHTIFIRAEEIDFLVKYTFFCL